MYPAPFKQSSPDGAERIQPIDGAALRKESWRFGASPSFYETISQSNYGIRKGVVSFDNSQRKKDIFSIIYGLLKKSKHQSVSLILEITFII